MNQIPSLQNEPKQIQRLAAQRQLYSIAKTFQGCQVILNILVVVSVSVFAGYYDQFLPIAALMGLLIAIVDIAFLDPQIRGKRMKAAKIQELFDCSVLSMDCSPLKTVDDVGLDEVLFYYDQHAKKKSRIEKLEDWYPKEVGNLPLEMARLLCQVASCRWDRKLRERYKSALWAVCIVVPIALTILGFAMKMNFVNLVLLANSVLPLILYCVKQVIDQEDAVKRLNSLSRYSDSLWKKAIAKTISQEDLVNGSRRLQDEIFDNRSKSSLVPDWAYGLFKDNDEKLMQQVTDELIKEALRTN